MSKALTDKIIVLGIDGMDAKLTKKFLKKGVMPNLQKIIDRGAKREDLVLLGGMPTVTPPMWTTLATGAYPGTHGITCFWNQDHDDLEKLVYAFDSKKCKAEQLWNVTAESGKKTLVWHWPGSSWPPTSDSPNLDVVSGSTPGTINADTGNVDWEKIFLGSEEIKEFGFKAHVEAKGGAGCMINDLDALVDAEKDESFKNMVLGGKAGGKDTLMMDESESELNQLARILPDMIKTPIKEASGWADAPEGAKEVVLLFSEGLVRRPCLILKNEQGIYDKLAIYKSKKETTPLGVFEKGKTSIYFKDEIKKYSGETVTATRSVRIVEMAEDGSSFVCWMSYALDTACDRSFHPTSLYKEIVENVGYVLPQSIMTSINYQIFKDCAIDAWDHYTDWQADCLNYVINNKDYDIIFSHLHNIDGIAHQCWHFAKYQEFWNYPEGTEKIYQGYMQYIYEQTDRYFGRFLHLLDEGWTLFVVSDHGLISEENLAPLLGEMLGVNIPVMRELGFTVIKQDENGNDLREIDWEKTRAIANRSNHIWINLKGRNHTGCVDPADKYELEREIIDALYNYRDPRTGKRVISLALRNKDAVILGMSGPECGDIVYFTEEGFNHVHGDSLPTQEGYYDTSVSPVFIAAGKGLKKSYKTDRVIRMVDVTPTIATLAGVRMPAQCEGAPVYQILDEDV